MFDARRQTVSFALVVSLSRDARLVDTEVHETLDFDALNTNLAAMFEATVKERTVFNTKQTWGHTRSQHICAYTPPQIHRRGLRYPWLAAVLPTGRPRHQHVHLQALYLH